MRLSQRRARHAVTLALFAVVGLGVYFLPSTNGAGPKGSVINVVLVGATGDLAKKYLWQSLFRLHIRSTTTPSQPRLVIWPAASSSKEKVGHSLEKILETKINCELGIDYPVPADQMYCEKDKRFFITNVVRGYTQLRGGEHYKRLNAAIVADTGTANVEAGRLFYLSIPPRFYSGIAQSIHNHARPPSANGAWLRVVMEKPFGSNLDTAKELAKNLQKHLKEEEMYRIDHYLGKLGVQAVINFRVANQGSYEPILNREHVERVEVVMKEKITCAGRTNFFDQYGIVRDVLQNHLTEIAALVAMELPSTGTADTESMLRNKASLLSKVRAPSVEQSVMGQYSGYNEHVNRDLQDNSGGNQPYKVSKQATFAAVMLTIDSERWQGVPFILSSGKALDERAAFVRVVFKRGQGELMINIQGGPGGTSISATSEAPLFSSPTGFTTSPVYSGETGTSLAVPEQLPVKNAYEVLIANVVDGFRQNFVTTKTLFPSWEIWTPLIEEFEESTTPPIKYGFGGAEVYEAIRKQSAEMWKNKVDELRSSEL